MNPPAPAGARLPRIPNSPAYQVKISAQRIDWPSECACCSGSPDTTVTINSTRVTGKRVIHSKTKGWNVPYCHNCVRHANLVKGGDKAIGSGIGCGFLAFIVMGLAAGMTAGFTCAVLCVAAGIGVCVALHNAARKLIRPSCCDGRWAAAYHGWYGTIHTFTFKNRVYLDHFQSTNAKKIVS
jgi:hypothetical protein